MAKKIVTPELRIIKAGTAIRIFNGTICTVSKPIKNDLKVYGNFSLYGIFKFQYKIKGKNYCCSVDFSELIDQ